ncbi:helix-turn-helix domain-containing protein [Enterococcus sp. UD-01]|jgi:hypothetical protein|uniref:helix-turn-helix domain-containing protein n=1 Tax=Enterococcus sp. UD-01 TaxID=3373911 RepID=UPI0038333EF1
MERILSPAMHRRVLLLNILNGTNGWFTSDYLAETINCSRKTVMLDCQYIEDRWEEHLSIETSRKNGIRLITSPHRSIHEIYVEIIQESNAFALLESVFFQPKEPAVYWEEKLFLSNSSLYRLSNLISSALKDRNIEMNRSPYYIYGNDERQIRYFFAFYFLEVYGIREWPFQVDKEKVFTLTNKINQDFNLQLNDSQMMQLAYLIIITMRRERQGFFIQPTSYAANKLVQTVSEQKSYYEDILEIVEPLNVVMADHWYEDFCYSVFWWKYGWDNEQERRNVIHQANQLIRTISEALSLEIAETSRKSIVRLMEYTYTRHKMFPHKHFMVYDRYLYSSGAVKNNFVVFAAVVSKALGKLEEKTKFPWKTMYADELLHEIAIRWKDLNRLSEKLRHQVSILVLSDLGQEHAQLLGSVLKENFQNKIKVSFQESHYFEKNVSPIDQSFDLYVSNFTVDGVDKNISMIVEDIPSFKNLTDLRKFINKRRLVLPEDINYLNS